MTLPTLRRIVPVPVLFLALSLVTLVWVPAAAGQESHPGYFPIETLDLVPAERVTVDINLQGAMLRMIAAVEKDDPDLAALVSGLKRIRVRIGELRPGDVEHVRAAIAEAATRLEDEGWQMTVRARDEGEEVVLYVKEQPGSDDSDGSDIAGLTLFVLDDENHVAMVNIVGNIDPERIAELPMLDDLDLGKLHDADDAE